jgi:hypothetical protein
MHRNRNFGPVVAVVGDNDADNPVEAAMMVRFVSLIHMAIEIESRSPDILNILHLALVETPERALDLAIQWVGPLPPVWPDLADFRVAPWLALDPLVALEMRGCNLLCRKNRIQQLDRGSKSGHNYPAADHHIGTLHILDLDKYSWDFGNSLDIRRNVAGTYDYSKDWSNTGAFRGIVGGEFDVASESMA